LKILVVDDDPVTGTLLNKVLSHQGYEVTHVVDGARALEFLEAERYRIILTDWMMPAMDGPTLCRHVRSLDLPYPIYIILLTAKNAKADAVTGLEAGADDYIVKPFDKQELLARVRAGRRLVDLEDTQRATQLKLSRTEKSLAVGHLAAGVAHEINNPIGFIKSNLNSLGRYMQDMEKMLACYRELVQTLDQSISQRQLHADLPGLLKKSIRMEQQYEIDFIIQDSHGLIADCSHGADRIRSIVNEMRYFAHPEQQTIATCSLAAILNKVVATLLSRGAPAITVSDTIQSLPEIACNAPHIEQAFANIIQNAVEAVDQDGAITIGGLLRNGNLEVEISDTGRGIATDHLTAVFNPFFTTKAIGQGLGLGLTTALNIIKMHNGTISCKSAPGQGATFTVSLPLGDEAT
jgi:two-component system, NtrC family, sensor kinase